MATKPAAYTGWVPDGSPLKITQPPSAQLASGFVPGEPPVAQYINWVLWNLDQWTQYLDQTLAASGAANAGALDNARLVGGGNWSFSAQTGTLSWSAAFQIAMPGIVDTDNQAGAGSVVVPDGSVAYVNAHVPFLTSGNTTAGSNQLTSVNYNAGIATGQVVNGAGIPAATTVTAIAGTTVTLSANATATATGVSLSFAGGAGLTVAVGDEGSLQPAAGTVILARRNGAVIIIGINAGEMILRDGETKLLRTTGYSVVYSGIAGETLTARAPVYISPGGSDGGRTAGSAYKADASLTNGSVRGQAIGVALSGASAGAAMQAIQSGIVGGFSSLSQGATYYVDPTTPGGLVAGRPTTAGQYAVPIGVAVNSTQIAVNAGVGTSAVNSGASQGNYGVFNETQFVSALASSVSAGGGVIIIESAFSLTAPRVLPAGTVLIGQLAQTVLTIASGGSLTMASGSRMEDVNVASSNASGNLVSVTGNNCLVNRCKFIPLAGSTVVCLSIMGSGTRLRNNTFAGVVGGTPTGIAYVSGTSNIDDSSVFT